MRFPKQELDIDQYMQTIESLLNGKDSHLFIDTNIITHHGKEQRGLVHLTEREESQLS